ncbi:MAG: ABC transporter ATP-binding protein [Planctomycetales bacterium]|nr:ABC transporter ATP-binding protein [Planctomycetales bacterium]
MLVEAKGLTKTYHPGAKQVAALQDVSLAFDREEFVAVCGPSGCGKSTLLLTIGGLLQPTAGDVKVAGTSLYGMTPAQRAAFRADTIGFVFQQFHLVPYLNVIDNVLSARLGATAALASPRERAAELIEQLGLGARVSHRPHELSVGERQRVALARALLNRPQLLLADEPTGNLDPANAAIVLSHLEQFVRDGGAIMLVTHDEQAAERAGRIVRIEAGRLQTNAAAGANQTPKSCGT